MSTLHTLRVGFGNNHAKLAVGAQEFLSQKPFLGLISIKTAIHSYQGRQNLTKIFTYFFFLALQTHQRALCSKMKAKSVSGIVNRQPQK